MSKWNKCNFCENNTWLGCDLCSHYDNYSPNSEAIIEKAKSFDISVMDVIKLIEYCGEN